jgi:hypothetical protein
MREFRDDPALSAGRADGFNPERRIGIAGLSGLADQAADEIVFL